MEMRTPALPIVHQLHHFLRTQRLEQYDIGSTEDRQCGTIYEQLDKKLDHGKKGPQI